jgi:glyoxylase-like metal-dependent hydrolase (beta-lactamase superfamily II)
MHVEESDIVQFRVGKIECFVFNAGSFRSDGGASFGVYPRSLWEKKVTPDKKHRIELAANLMLLKTPRFNLLIDSGLGYHHDPQTEKIYSPEPCQLLEKLSDCGCSPDELDFLVLTHLHHDHIGGIWRLENGQEELMFPQAIHIIQKEEWQTAHSPDKLNEAAYRFNKPLQLLARSHSLKLIEGNFELSPEISLLLTSGHTNATQVVRIESEGELCYYPGDLIPHDLHLHLPVTSAYDVSRNKTFFYKERILADLKEKQGYLVFNHQPDKKLLKFPLT